MDESPKMEVPEDKLTPGQEDAEIEREKYEKQLEFKLQEALQHLQPLQDLHCKRSIFSAWRLLWTDRPEAPARFVASAPAGPVLEEGSDEDQVCTLKTLEDFLQEADEELKAGNDGCLMMVIWWVFEYVWSFDWKLLNIFDRSSWPAATG